jgi:hypothetical protein
VIHFIVIGGDDVSAKVLGWTMKLGSVGNQSVTGVGFRPTTVVHVHVGADFTSNPPASGASACIGLGAMADSGSQWTTTFYTTDNSKTSDTQRYQRTTKVIAGISSGNTVAKEAQYVSMDADGFTINWTTIDGAASRVFSLALKGINVGVGGFNKTVAAAPASQSVTGLSFKPKAVLLASYQDVAQTTVQTHSRFGLGASNQINKGSSAVQDTDALGITSVDGIDKTSKAFVKVNNNTPAIDAEADLTSFDSAGFTLDWTTNDAVATEILYLAIASGRRIWIVARNREGDPRTEYHQALSMISMVR